MANLPRAAGRLTLGLALCTGVAASGLAFAADDYPNKPITFVVPFAPGGGTDMLTRAVSDRLAKELGQPILVENRAGGNTLIAAQHVARAKPDGYTVLTAIDSTMAMNQHLYSSLPYDPLKDFIPVTLAISMPMVIAVNPDFPAKTLPELMTHLKEHPNDVNYAFGALPAQVVGERFKMESGLTMEAVPYNGSSPAQQDVMGGHVPVLVDALAPALSLLRSDRLRPLAVSSAERAPTLPDVPTVAESGLPGFDAITWTGFFLPAGTPQAVVDKLHAGISKVLQDPAVRTQFEDLGQQILGAPGPEFAELIQRDSDKNGEVIREAGIKIN
ncbi:MAG: Bug family tripartite tricarboxylate transporter substrate binding protein [Pigmentiphaga sp.]